MMSDENFVVSQEYNEKASQFILDEFVELRKRGIYEDRIMRKLKSFTKSQVLFLGLCCNWRRSDCNCPKRSGWYLSWVLA